MRKLCYLGCSLHSGGLVSVPADTKSYPVWYENQSDLWTSTFKISAVHLRSLDPFTAKFSQRQISTKFPNFILWNVGKQIALCVSTGRKLLFEWSHHRIWSADLKVRVTLKNSIKHSDSERVKVNFNCRVIFTCVRTEKLRDSGNQPFQRSHRNHRSQTWTEAVSRRSFVTAQQILVCYTAVFSVVT